MAGRGKRNYATREFRSTNRRVNTVRSPDQPSTSSHQNCEEWNDNLTELSKQPFTDMQPGFIEHRAWFDELSTAWNQSNNDLYITTRLLKVSYNSSSNPYRTALYFMCESPDFRTGKTNSLSSAVMKAFEDWLKENTSRKFEISFELQAEAFEAVGSQNNSHLTQLVAEIYRLGNVGEHLLERVKQMVTMRDYKQACLFATLLNIQKHFNINEFLVPLLLQDRVNFVQNYLDKCPEQQEVFVQFIDSMCTYEKNAFQIVGALQIPDAKAGKWNPRAFKKLGSRLMKLYNISPEVCSNISQINNIGTLKYLLHKKYTEGNISDEAWEEMIEAVIKNDVGLQVELCSLLLCYDDLPCAIKCAHKYNVPRDQLPETLQTALEDREKVNYLSYKSGQNENWDDVVDPEPSNDHMYHSLSLPFSAIVNVVTKQQFERMLDAFQVANVIGCDCEWKPGAGSKLSIIQIATWEQIFIIDVKVILENNQLDQIDPNWKIDAKDWRTLALAVFANVEIKKLGFGFSTDLKMLSQCLPECERLNMETKNLLDLHGLTQKLTVMHPEIFLYDFPHSSRGLTDIVGMCLGKKLDKREQFSNWDNRPLRQRQTEYAALDAYCLLEVYNVLQSRAAELGIDLDLMMNIRSKKKTKSPNSTSENGPHSSCVNSTTPCSPHSSCENSITPPPPCSPGQFRVVVDSMLQGLGRQLRLMGVDVKMVENTDEPQTALRIGINENRIILSTGSSFEKFLQYVQPGMCHHVNTASTQREQAHRVLNCFNVQVTTQDIFSRCPKCNNSRYIRVPSEHVRQLWQNSSVLSKMSLFKTPLWISYENGKLDTLNLKTDENAVIQFDGVNDELFKRVDLFYICATCGKVYWEGSHLKRLVSALKNVVISE
uniref:3'-5' exonuclease domain-containing protein n=1 Tax=Strigamia maritima TaxID=126957 RepID=T1J5A6_STRMM